MIQTLARHGTGMVAFVVLAGCAGPGPTKSTPPQPAASAPPTVTVTTPDAPAAQAPGAVNPAAGTVVVVRVVVVNTSSVRAV